MKQKQEQKVIVNIGTKVGTRRNKRRGKRSPNKNKVIDEITERATNNPFLHRAFAIPQVMQNNPDFNVRFELLQNKLQADALRDRQRQTELFQGNIQQMSDLMDQRLQQMAQQQQQVILNQQSSISPFSSVPTQDSSSFQPPLSQSELFQVTASHPAAASTATAEGDGAAAAAADVAASTTSNAESMSGEQWTPELTELREKFIKLFIKDGYSTSRKNINSRFSNEIRDIRRLATAAGIAIEYTNGTNIGIEKLANNLVQIFGQSP